jgi:hypothetical protein
MTEAQDETTSPTPPPTPRVRRKPKFTLPDHHHEEEAAERIEAFLDGPQVRRRRRSHRYHRRHAIALDTDVEWSGALRHEAARSARYGRSMAILVVDLTVSASTAGPDGLALRLTEVLGREARETDRAVRRAPERFLVLLPETNEDEAAHLASRIERAYRHLDDAIPVGDIRIEIAVPRRGTDPSDAIAVADRRLAEPLAAG